MAAAAHILFDSNTNALQVTAGMNTRKATLFHMRFRSMQHYRVLQPSFRIPLQREIISIY